MANPEHEQKLAEGVPAWNAWRRQNSREQIDLSGCELVGRKLSGINLSRAQLRGADLTQADLTLAGLASSDLSGARLTSADLTDANLSAARLQGADLAGARLTEAVLKAADLSAARLCGADLELASLDAANLAGADLTGVTGLTYDGLLAARVDARTVLPAQFHHPAALASYEQALAAGVEVANAWRWVGRDGRPELAGRDFSGRQLRQVDLSGASLAGSNFSAADLGEAELGAADLGAARLVDAILADARLARANLTGANLAGADCRQALLDGADLSGADLAAARNLTQGQIERAHDNSGTRLPQGLLHPGSWLTLQEAVRAGTAAVAAWRKHWLSPDRDPVLADQSFAGLGLRGIDLSYLMLDGCDFTDADLAGADLTGASMKGADLSRARGLSAAQLEAVTADQATRLPAGLVPPLHWSGLRPSPLFDDLDFAIRRSPLREHLVRPLRRLASDVRALLVLPRDAPPFLFTGEDALPAVDLRQADAITFAKAVEVAFAVAPVETGRFAGRTLYVVGTLHPAPQAFADVTSERRLRAELASEIGIGTREVMRHLLQALREQPGPAEADDAATVEAALPDALARLVAPGDRYAVSGLKMLLVAETASTPEPELPAMHARHIASFDGEDDLADPEELHLDPFAGEDEFGPAELGARRDLNLASAVVDGPARAPGRGTFVDALQTHAREPVPGSAVFAGPRSMAEVVPPEIAAAVRDGVPQMLAGATAHRRPQRSDPVLCSVFAPPRIRPGAAFDIQVFLHLETVITRIAREAMAHDASARRQARSALEVEPLPGQRISLYLEAPELDIAEPIQDVEWHAPAQAARFAVALGRETTTSKLSGLLFVALDDIPVGEIAFELGVVREPQPIQPAPASRASAAARAASPLALVDRASAAPSGAAEAAEVPVLAAQDARRYARAFLSYSRGDVAYASIFAEGLTSNGIELFVDVMAMEPGDDWRVKLAEGIEAADVFFLLWSHKAAGSHWVGEECRAACARLQRYRQGEGRPIAIRPVVIGDNLPPPPHCLADLHCDSRWRAMRLAGSHPLFARV